MTFEIRDSLSNTILICFVPDSQFDGLHLARRQRNATQSSAGTPLFSKAYEHWHPTYDQAHQKAKHTNKRNAFQASQGRNRRRAWYPPPPPLPTPSIARPITTKTAPQPSAVPPGVQPTNETEGARTEQNVSRPEKGVCYRLKKTHSCCHSPLARLRTLSLAAPSGADHYPSALKGTDTLQAGRALTCRKPPDTR